MNRETLRRIYDFVVELEEAMRDTSRSRVREAGLARAFHRLSPDIKDLVEAGYRQCLAARARGGAHRAEAARYEVMAHLIGGTGLTREQIMAVGEAAPRLVSWRPWDDADDDNADGEPLVSVPSVAAPRADSSPGAHPVATAVDVPEDDSRPYREMRWRPTRRHLTSLGVLAACAAAVLIAASWLPRVPSRERISEPAEKHVFPVERLVDVDDGVVLFTHGESDGDETWIYAYEWNVGDSPRPAARQADDESDDANDVAGQIVEIDENAPIKVIPPNSVRRHRLKVKPRGDGNEALIELKMNQKKAVRLIPLPR